MDENYRLLKLLEYSKEAIAYWYDGCGDVDDETIKENEFYQDECKWFIEKIKDSK